MSRHLLPAFAFAAFLASPAHAKGPKTDAAPAAMPVAVVVEIPLPAQVPRAAVEVAIREAVPQYRQVPGLLRKVFTIGAGTFGGLYLFANRAAAEAWFSPAWSAQVRATYGAEPRVTYADAPTLVDNAKVPCGTTNKAEWTCAR